MTILSIAQNRNIKTFAVFIHLKNTKSPLKIANLHNVEYYHNLVSNQVKKIDGFCNGSNRNFRQSNRFGTS